MNSMRLPSLSTDKPHYRTAKQDNGTYHNRPDQRFNQKSPNLIRVRDITYLKAAGKWYSLRIVMDLFPRKVVPRELSPKADSELEIRTFRKACSLRGCTNGLMSHSERGSQYTSYAFKRVPDERNVVQSFPKKSCPFDNACCECFFKYLRKEETSRRTCHHYNELFRSVFR